MSSIIIEDSIFSELDKKYGVILSMSIKAFLGPNAKSTYINKLSRIAKVMSSKRGCSSFGDKFEPIVVGRRLFKVR